MPAELGDERSFKDAMRTAAGVAGREEIQAAIEDAVRFANRALLQLGENPPPGASMDEWSVQAIADSVEVSWERGESEGKLERGNALVAEWTHPHADKINVGVKPHMIEGDPILVFEWPGMPEGVRKEFEPRWNDPDNFLEEPMVAFAKVDHPGIPSTQFIQSGFQRALRKHFSDV
jgi:hypothetical protein